MALDEKQIKNVCRPGQGAKTCSFLLAGPDGMECAKGTPLEGMIWARRSTMNAKGENCSGPPNFRPFDDD